MTNASSLELLWTAIAAIGLAYSLVNLSDSLGDRRALLRSGLNGIRSRIVSRTIRKDLARIFMFLVNIALGVVAINTPPLMRQSTSIWGALVALGFMAIAFAMMLNAVLDRATRRELLAELSRQGRKA